jgi:hypothetical protein
MNVFLPLIAAIFLVSCNNLENKKAAKTGKSDDSIENKASEASRNWAWPDSLDAVTAARESHKIVFEDSTVRILQVVCPPGVEEPIHTHRYKSVMWFTQSAHFIYYNYVLDDGNQLVKKDSSEIKGFPSEVLNKGQMVDPEHPHSIKNIGTETFMAYRVEYKKDFK